VEDEARVKRTRQREQLRQRQEVVAKVQVAGQRELVDLHVARLQHRRQDEICAQAECQQQGQGGRRGTAPLSGSVAQLEPYQQCDQWQGQRRGEQVREQQRGVRQRCCQDAAT
jgi:hypothetical protein